MQMHSTKIAVFLAADSQAPDNAPPDRLMYKSAVIATEFLASAMKRCLDRDGLIWTEDLNRLIDQAEFGRLVPLSYIRGEFNYSAEPKGDEPLNSAAAKLIVECIYNEAARALAIYRGEPYQPREQLTFTQYETGKRKFEPLFR